MIRISRWLPPLLAMALGTAMLPAQTAPALTLNAGARVYPESFSKVDQLIELRDGRLLLLDSGESALLLVDMARNSSSKVSRKGAGPLEYQPLGLLLGGSADTVLFYDVMQRRFLQLSPTAKPLGTKRLERGDDVATLMKPIPRASDAKGRLYGQTMGIGAMPTEGKGKVEMPKFADSIEIQRLDANGGKATTLAWIRNAVTQSKPKVEMSGSTVKMTITAPSFQHSDNWAVLPDGRVAVLRNGVYRVQFVSESGKVSLGPLVPYTPIPVTAAEKKSLVDSMRKELSKAMAESEKAMAGMSSAGGKEIDIPKFDINILEPTTWAATKPAYVALSSSPDGRLWVTLSRVAGTRTTRYDLLSGSGALLAHIQLAVGERLVGLGRGTVYTVTLDDDDLQTLKRYTLPPLR